MNSDVDALVFLISKRKVIFVFVLCIVFLVFGLLNTILNIEDRSMVIVGILCALVAAFGIVSMAVLLSAKDGLHIDRDGIEDKVNYPKQGKIYWNEIESIDFHKTHVYISLFHPENFISRQKGFTKWLCVSRWRFTGTPVSISLLLLKTNEYEIRNYLKNVADTRKYLQEHLP